jgi:hypothetical protein
MVGASKTAANAANRVKCIPFLLQLMSRGAASASQKWPFGAVSYHSRVDGGRPRDVDPI